MSMIVIRFKQVLLACAVVALGLGAVPIANVFALGPAAPVTPTPPIQQSTSRLGRVWSREQAIYTRLGTFFNNSDQILSKAQDLINKAKANGKDTSALQSALDTFSQAVKQAEPVYQSAGGILSSHQGFDANGNVIDRTQAIATVKDFASQLKNIRQLLRDPRKALREAIKAFRAANRPAITPAPTQTSG
jgi:uncharacterized protein YukE